MRIETKETRSEPLVIAFLAFMSLVLAFGVDIALPAFGELRDHFGLAPDDTSISLVITLYFIGFATGQLFFGVLSDAYGRRLIILIGLGVYALGALASALASSFELVLVSRFVWGIGASSPGVIRSAIARDLYSGDDMSRIVTVTMAVFLIGPIFIPFVGLGILSIGPWQLVFLAGLVMATFAAAMTVKFGETLALDKRRPVSVKPMVAAAKRIARTPQTTGRIAAQTLYSASFFVFLASSEPIISNIYDRESQFAFWFAIVGVVTIVLLLISSKLIRRLGAERWLLTVATIELAASLVGAGLFALSDGPPSFGIWFAWAAVSSAILTVCSPLCNSLALQPMGEMAGIASAVLGFATVAIGAAVASFVSSLLAETVLPMAVAYSLFAATALAVLWWSHLQEKDLTP